MAGKGFAPKETLSRPNDARRRERETRSVTADGRARGPKLPEDVLPGGEEWHPRTAAWWETWRKSAQATTFGPTDWDFLLDTALLHHVMWTKGKWEFASEVRLRAAKFGATPEDRMRLKMTVDDPQGAGGKKPAAPAGTVTEIASRRARLSE
ncbi:phage terminase small subunit [Streptomonospora wellingtoniae]|uniref:Terminase small subunit n=1 Tax=Streptomonospora wellingtoniae TaxID=3075544 RepID=A0ABU2KUD4_9ACTN|nr:hypothetical protein [Streptomonospora sp. DSM 45055]MDT0302912.1 hypothetical protein [Streptomonospora sp. DSM 45055]